MSGPVLIVFLAGLGLVALGCALAVRAASAKAANAKKSAIGGLHTDSGSSSNCASDSGGCDGGGGGD
jgi:hypothetical protein